ncbi:MAG: alpha/beta hydrolase family protein [Eubacteriales bacterium]|nr:alpha/beta hydrolase family protein [Eubacteriales bacterium]
MALLHADFFSDALGMCAEMDVILPEETKGQIGMEGRAGSGKYPTLYLLHGMSDDHTIWQRRTSIERYVADKGIAVVMPSTHLGWYTDMYYGFDYWTYISKELPQICRSFFPNMSTRREDTFAAGLSMGGYGALKLGLGASETFGAVAALSAATDVVKRCQTTDLGREDYFLSIFGPKEQVKGSDNDLWALADRLAASGKEKSPIYMWCGTEDSLLEENHRLRDHLQTRGFDVTYEESTGDHSWGYWDAKIQTVLNWLPIDR